MGLPGVGLVVGQEGLVVGWREPAVAGVVGQVEKEELLEPRTLEPFRVCRVGHESGIGSDSRYPSCWVEGVWEQAGVGSGQVGVAERADQNQEFYVELVLVVHRAECSGLLRDLGLS